MCDVGILRSYISDHNAILCVLYDTTVSNDQNSCIKRNFCRKKNISKFCKYLKNESWDNIYYSCTQEAFTEFQGLINSYFENCMQQYLNAMQ